MYDNIIIIPYRNRKEHLDIFIRDVIPLFKKYLKKFKIVIIEQSNEKEFNRGKLLNIGFKEYMFKSLFYFNHDIDIIPKENTVKYLYTINDFDILRLYCGHDSSLGGIIKFNCNSFIRMNGYPNYIFGWGIEDRVLYYRASICKINMTDNLANKGNFIFLNHKSSTNNNEEINKFETHLFNSCTLHQQLMYIKMFGLNDLKYNILNRKNINEYVEMITVSI